MNIYAKKQLWKRVLVAIGVVLVLSSLWFTNNLVQRIAKEERQKIRLWAEAIQKKARLVNYTDQLFDKLRDEERKKVEIWAEASSILAGSADITSDFSFLTKVITGNTTVPVIWTTKDGIVKAQRNVPEDIAESPELLQKEIEKMAQQFDPIEIVYASGKTDYLYYEDSRIITELERTFEDLENSFISEVVSNTASVPVLYIKADHNEVIAYGNVDSTIVYDSIQRAILIDEMKASNTPIEIQLQEGESSFIYYKNSDTLKALTYFPYVQLSVMGIFIFIAYYLFSTARRSEQNQVWVGMAKETAHQLGTPLSSLVGWVTYLESKGEIQIAQEIDKDVSRLQMVTERFSKIGSLPELTTHNIIEVVGRSVAYFKQRKPKKVNIDFEFDNPVVEAQLNPSLFEWVIENLMKNALDALEGKGEIKLHIFEEGLSIVIEISDSGKGMTLKNKADIFQPGYTTKKRGWGLGLTLAKRIVESYHKGKIVVKSTKPGLGTTFRITLPK